MRHLWVWLAGGSLVVFLLCLLSINTDTGSDPKLTLLVSQALVDHGSMDLTPYRGDVIIGRPFEGYVADGVIVASGDHYSHYFPAGPSIVAMPAVALARLAGWDMRTADSYRLQELLSALSAAAVFLLAFALARCYVADRPALAISFISVLGSSLVSTLGTAYWTHNVAVLAIGGALWLLARVDAGRAERAHPVALGALLFTAFICRATAIAFILPVFGYLAARRRQDVLPAGVTAAALLLVYLVWSARAGGEAAYYSPARLAVERASLGIVLAGLLVSPSRGVLIFSPFLLVVAAGCLAHWKRLWRRPMVWLCLAWFGLHLLLVARAASWWGGWSFGPRLLTDLWPGLIVLTALWWAEAEARERHAQAWATAYLGLGLVGIAVNAGVGLYSQPGSRWNVYIDPISPARAPGGDLFNWRYAQPLASNRMLCAIERDKLAAEGLESSLVSVAPGDVIRFDADQVEPFRLAEPPRPVASIPAEPRSGMAIRASASVRLPILVTSGNQAVFAGWANPETVGAASWRWSQCPTAELRFLLSDVPIEDHLTLEVRGSTFGHQVVRYSINGTEMGEIAWAGETPWTGSAVETHTIEVPTGLLRPGAINTLAFAFPDAHFPSLRDQRPLGLALRSVALLVGSQDTVESPASAPSEGYPSP